MVYSAILSELKAEAFLEIFSTLWELVVFALPRVFHPSFYWPLVVALPITYITAMENHA